MPRNARQIGTTMAPAHINRSSKGGGAESSLSPFTTTAVTGRDLSVRCLSLEASRCWAICGTLGETQGRGLNPKGRQANDPTRSSRQEGQRATERGQPKVLNQKQGSIPQFAASLGTLRRKNRRRSSASTTSALATAPELPMRFFSAQAQKLQVHHDTGYTGGKVHRESTQDCTSGRWGLNPKGGVGASQPKQEARLHPKTQTIEKRGATALEEKAVMSRTQ